MKITQEQQVVETMRKEGGIMTLRHLNELVDTSNWKTKTPDATIRRIVQNSNRIFRIQPGLWALEESKDAVLRKLKLQPGNGKTEEIFSHGYYQGLLVEIGRFRHFSTYIPPQDQNRKFVNIRLGDMADTHKIPTFTYDKILRRAKTVDVIWFNQRQMPSSFYEVEHTTDIKNSLLKFYELQDFYADFYIVADIKRKNEYEDKMQASVFNPIRGRVKFLDYQRVVKTYEVMNKANSVLW